MHAARALGPGLDSGSKVWPGFPFSSPHENLFHAFCPGPPRPSHLGKPLEGDKSPVEFPRKSTLGSQSWGEGETETSLIWAPLPLGLWVQAPSEQLV